MKAWRRCSWDLLQRRVLCSLGLVQYALSTLISWQWLVQRVVKFCVMTVLAMLSGTGTVKVG